MAKTNPETILLRGDPNRFQWDANETLTPGMLVELMSTNKLRKHATAGGNAAAIFVLENELGGQTIDDTYASGSAVQVNVCRPGDEVYAYLADGQTAVIGSFLGSAGNGKLEVASQGSFGSDAAHAAVGIALEAVDMSGSAGVDPSGRIRILVV